MGAEPELAVESSAELRPVAWFGAPPTHFAKGRSLDVGVGLWRVDRDAPLEIATEGFADRVLICAHLTGSIDLSARLADRRYDRPCLPGTFNLMRAQEAAWGRIENAHADFAHVYLPVALFDQFLADAAQGDPSRLDLVDPQNATCPVVARWAASMARAVRRGDPCGALEVEGACLMIAAALLERHSATRWRPYRGRRLSTRQLRAVREHVEDNIAETLTLADLATAAGAPLYDFGRVFARTVGVTPHQYVLSRRVARACALLSGGCLPIGEIAYACGFSSQSHMTDVFGKRLGVTPRRYRECHR